MMPNHVDISRTAELFATVSENFVVLALLCAFFGLYLVTLMWACYADRRSSSKVSLCMSVANTMLSEVKTVIRITIKKHKGSFHQAGLEQKSVVASRKTATLLNY